MNTSPHTIAPAIGPVLGLTRTELQRATLANFIDAHIRRDKADLGFFRELSDQVTKVTGQATTSPTSYLIPADMLGVQRRDMLTTNSGAIVGAEIAGFSDALNKRSILNALPISRLQNLTADITITPQTVQHSTAWLADEGVTEAGSTPGTLGSVSLTPKPLATVLTVSHQMMKMVGPAARAFIDNSLAAAVTEAVDQGIIVGSGSSGQPQGVMNAAGVDTRAGTAFDSAAACAMLRVADGRQLAGSLVWVAGVATAQLLRQREAAAGSGMLIVGNTMLGIPVVVSRSAPDNSLVIAEWESIYFGEWGSLEIGVDPFTNFATGKAIVRCLWRVDVAAARPGQVAVATAVS